MRHLAATKPDRRFDLIAIHQPIVRVLHAIFIIMIVGAGAKLDLFDRDDNLLLLRLVGFLLGFVLKLAKVDNTTHGRIGCGCNLDQIQAFFARSANGFARLQDSELFSVVINHAHFGHADSFVDARDGSAPIVGAMTATSKTCSYFCTSIVGSLKFQVSRPGSKKSTGVLGIWSWDFVTNRARCDETTRLLFKLFERHCADVALNALADGELAFFHLAVAKHKHKRNFL